MPRTPHAAPAPVFLAAIAVSSFTLFMFELLVGRLALPVFGGTPSVWTTALCFFTTVVFLGYLYAHALVTRVPRRAGAVLHLALAVLAAVAALAGPADVAALRIEGLAPVVNVLMLLALVAGAPTLLLATTTPLLSAWYAESGRDPWWLYAVSNAASLTGLLAYPFAIEPWIGLAAQRQALAVLVTVLAGLLGWVALARVRASAPAPATSVDPPTAPHAHFEPAPVTMPSLHAPAAPEALPLRRQLVWLLAAIVPAGLLPATSTVLTTDYVSSPLLWIGPLAVYLGSFVVAFSERGRRALPIAEKLLPAALVGLWLPFGVQLDWPVGGLVALMLSAFAVVAVVIHGRLALDRPDEAHLTRFYVLLSAGGMIATALVALVAPVVFSDVYEYPLLLLAVVLTLALLPSAARRNAAEQGAPAPRTLARRLAPFAIGLALAATALPIAFAPPTLERVRTFFGITEVRTAEGGQAIEEIHGTTLHGLQFTDERRTEPTAYFVRTGPLGDIMGVSAKRHAGGTAIGVVGLGVGTVASYARSSDSLAYFEVDQAVIDLALDERYFTYLTDAKAEPRIVLGDGRLSLAAEPPASYDLIVLDAFSSDAVPVHLLTREAMRTYTSRLRPGGLIAFQLTNRSFDLVPAVASTARSLGLDVRTRTHTPTSAEKDRLAAQPSRWLVVGDAEALAAFESRGWAEPATGPVLTDDYSDILRLMKW